MRIPNNVSTVGSCDALVEAMKGHCPSMQGVYERSDAMLSIYPGEGTRFAKHIDNSTGTSIVVCATIL